MSDASAPLAATPQQARSDWPALSAALLTVCLWASAFVGIRSAGKSFSPGALTFGRLVVATFALATPFAIRAARLPSRAELRMVWRPLVGCSLLWFFAYNLALNSGERRVDAGTASMITNVGPVLIALIAGRALGEGYPKNLLRGCVLAFVGVAIIAISSSTQSSTATGVMLCLSAAFSYAGGVVLQKLVLAAITPLATIFFCCVLAVVCSAPFAPALLHSMAQAPAGRIAWLAYLGAFPTAVAFTSWAFALRRGNAGRLGATTYLVPPLSVFLGWIVLGETPAHLAYLGGAICVCGVAWARR